MSHLRWRCVFISLYILFSTTPIWLCRGISFVFIMSIGIFGPCKLLACLLVKPLQLLDLWRVAKLQWFYYSSCEISSTTEHVNRGWADGWLLMELIRYVGWRFCAKYAIWLVTPPCWRCFSPGVSAAHSLHFLWHCTYNWTT